MCNCTLILLTSTRHCESFTRQSKKVECLLEKNLQMKGKGLIYFKGSKTLMVIDSLFIWYVLRFFPTWTFLVLECAVTQNWYFYKWKPLLKKLTLQILHSYHPFIGILKKNSSEAKLEPCQTSFMGLSCEKS